MIPYEIYKVFHIVGVFMVVTGLTASGLFAWVASDAQSGHPARKLAAATHGFGLLLVLVAGFGMLARLQISPEQPWVIGKLVIWLILGGMIALVRRLPRHVPMVWLLVFALSGTAAYLAIFKP